MQIYLSLSQKVFFSGEDARHSKLLDKFDHGSVGSIRRLPLAVSFSLYLLILYESEIYKFIKCLVLLPYIVEECPISIE